MDSLGKKTTKPTPMQEKSNVTEAANDLLNESKKLANELYAESLNKITEAEEQMKVYSDRMLKKVQEKPIASMLIAGGIGFLLAKLLKK